MNSHDPQPGEPALAYQMLGDKSNPAIVFLHGFTGSGEDWSDLARPLAERYFLIIPDLPGHGQTRIDDPKFYTMGYSASLVIKLLDSLRVTGCHLAAYSMGGRLGIFLLSQFPDRFDRAILESTSPGLDNEKEREARRVHDETLAQSLTENGLRPFLDNWYKQPIFAAMRRYSERLGALIERRQNNDPHGLALSLRMMGTGTQPNLWPELPNIRHRLLFMVGEYDRKFRDIADRMGDLCPQAKVCTIADSGHNVHFEQPDAYRDALTSFLE